VAVNADAVSRYNSAVPTSKLQRFVLGFIALVVVIFVIDYVQLKARGAAGIGSVPLMVGTAMKDGRVQIFTGDDQTESCVRALFPHFGFNPCWYVKQNSTQIISQNF
jgi:hypothetical protein